MNKRMWIGNAVALAFSGAAIAADPPAAPKPAPEHEKLGYFVGHWTMEGTVKDSPMGPGGKMQSRDHCEWFDGGFAVVCKGKGSGPAGEMTNLGILAYSSEEKAYTYYGIDNSGMVQMTVPRGTHDGDTWTYTDESKMGGKMVKSRYVIKEVSATSYTFHWDVQGNDGKWSTLVEGTETKKAKGAKKGRAAKKS